MDVLTSLRKYYESLLRNKDFPLRKACRDDVLTFATQVNDMMFDLKMQVSRAKLLVRITADRKNLVSASTFSASQKFSLEIPS